MLATFALAFGTAAGSCAGLLFLVAAVAKLRRRSELPAVIANYRLLPRLLTAPAALLLPWVEGVLALALVAGGRAATIASWPAMMLLVLFASAMHVNLRRGRSHIDCGCGISGLRQTLRPVLVWRNVALAAALLPLAVARGVLDPLAHVAAVLAGVAAFLLVLVLDALVALPGNRSLTA